MVANGGEWRVVRVVRMMANSGHCFSSALICTDLDWSNSVYPRTLMDQTSWRNCILQIHNLLPSQVVVFTIICAVVAV